jgi:hypothetical protein
MEIFNLDEKAEKIKVLNKLFQLSRKIDYIKLIVV